MRPINCLVWSKAVSFGRRRETESGWRYVRLCCDVSVALQGSVKMFFSFKQYLRPLLARDRSQTHRAATELELLFDLAVVIAISAAAHGLTLALERNLVSSGLEVQI